jgi:hypothetical protein
MDKWVKEIVENSVDESSFNKKINAMYGIQPVNEAEENKEETSEDESDLSDEDIMDIASEIFNNLENKYDKRITAILDEMWSDIKKIAEKKSNKNIKDTKRILNWIKERIEHFEKDDFENDAFTMMLRMMVK